MSDETTYKEFSVKTMKTGSSLTRKILVMLDVYSVSLLTRYFVCPSTPMTAFFVTLSAQ